MAARWSTPLRFWPRAPERRDDVDPAFECVSRRRRPERTKSTARRKHPLPSARPAILNLIMAERLRHRHHNWGAASRAPPALEVFENVDRRVAGHRGSGDAVVGRDPVDLPADVRGLGGRERCARRARRGAADARACHRGICVRRTPRGGRGRRVRGGAVVSGIRFGINPLQWYATEDRWIDFTRKLDSRSSSPTSGGGLRRDRRVTAARRRPCRVRSWELGPGRRRSRARLPRVARSRIRPRVTTRRPRGPPGAAVAGAKVAPRCSSLGRHEARRRAGRPAGDRVRRRRGPPRKMRETLVRWPRRQGTRSYLVFLHQHARLLGSRMRNR